MNTFNNSRPVLLTCMGLSETQIALISIIYIWVQALLLTTGLLLTASPLASLLKEPQKVTA